ncbi:MAG: recombination protein RecR [Clostridiaceae bacterium]|nr:recombination mediator RecR [Clostridiales bacterium]MDD2441421.1 recombination mediator RecR [Eubacteriales bacterium]MDD4139075.1 recombination mediator RecR [Eubacteriales bacterium]MDD4743203.1 recombination mediator RecR [Eubacteriales bacterium]NLB43807.1 recombination protein RecR [Clostridiaceae bacterium]
MARYAPSIGRLITELAKLPGIGGKSAQRLAFHLLGQPEDQVSALANAILDARKTIRLCSVCCNLTDQDPCEICASPARDHTTICVVENPRDVASIERMHEYKGLYHVLHGAISPMQGVGPDQIRLRELLARLRQDDSVHEVILATNPTVEGEATALYLARLLKPAGILTTRIAHGIPMGGDLEYADEVTLARAMEGRREIG